MSVASGHDLVAATYRARIPPSLHDVDERPVAPREPTLPGPHDVSRADPGELSRADRFVASAGDSSAGRDVSRRARAVARRRGDCWWCQQPVVASRVDARYCSKSCRQAGHRASIRRADPSRGDRAMRFAYADPPYPGLAKRYYADHPDYAGEVDLDELLSRLQRYDGWALSTSARALPDVLARCVARGLSVRVAAWLRHPRPHQTARVLSSWEPVVFSGGRRRARQVTDVLVGVTPRRRRTLPTAVVGMKPPRFAEWVFQLLGATLGDELDDLYPGSGLVARTWELYQGRQPSRSAAAGPSRPARASHDASYAFAERRDT